MKNFEIYNTTRNESIIVIEAKNIGAAWDKVNKLVENANIIDITVRAI